MKTYETPRLILREFNPTIQESLKKGTKKQRADFFGGGGSLNSLDLQAQFLDSFVDTHRYTFRHWFMVSKENGQVLGDCGFHRWSKIHKWAEVGYGLRSMEDQNQGFMSEALIKILEIGVTDMKLVRIEAFVEPDNISSLKLIHKMGFRAEGRHNARHEQGKKALITFRLVPADMEAPRSDLPPVVDAFERQTLPFVHWTHRAHLEVGLWYSLNHDWAEALLQMRNGIISYNQIVGTENSSSGGYHETLTQFWLKIIHQFLEKQSGNFPFDQICDAFWLSRESNKELPLEYYSRERLFSVRARAEWVEPDLKDIK